MSVKPGVQALYRDLQAMAAQLLEEAADRRDEGRLSPIAYNKVYRTIFLPLMRQSVGLLARDAVRSAAAIDQHLKGVREASTSLSKAMGHIKKVEDIVAFGAQLVEVGEAVLGFVNAPSLSVAETAAKRVKKVIKAAKKL